MNRRPWSDFAQTHSKNPHAVDVAVDDLVHVAETPYLRCVVAYAQEALVYEGGRMVLVGAEAYAATKRSERVNVFGLAYRPNAPFLQHRLLAEITDAAAKHLYETQGWRTVLFDGLRTVEATYKLYCLATDADLASGLLALPGKSAHNKGLAVDSMMFDAHAREVDMGGHFDHPDMETNSRAYTGNAISDAAKQNRLIREAAFLRAAFLLGRLIAPLRTEFWDDRPPEDASDLWRVLDSAGRVVGKPLLTEATAHLRSAWEQWNYADFLRAWKQHFTGLEGALMEAIGTTTPPKHERDDFYHGHFHPIYDRELFAFNKHLTDVATFPISSS